MRVQAQRAAFLCAHDFLCCAAAAQHVNPSRDSSEGVSCWTLGWFCWARAQDCWTLYAAYMLGWTTISRGWLGLLSPVCRVSSDLPTDKTSRSTAALHIIGLNQIQGGAERLSQRPVKSNFIGNGRGQSAVSTGGVRKPSDKLAIALRCMREHGVTPCQAACPGTR